MEQDGGHDHKRKRDNAGTDSSATQERGRGPLQGREKRKGQDGADEAGKGEHERAVSTGAGCGGHGDKELRAISKQSSDGAEQRRTAAAARASSALAP